MIRIRRRRKVSRMTLVAASICQLIVAIGVTGLAGRRDMGSRQRKPCRAVIEGRRLPHGRRMACFTTVIQHSGGMIWIRWPLVRRLVTWIAIGVHQLVVAIGMAQLTCCCRVRTGERKLRRTVIEGRRFPYGRRMARLAHATDS